MSQPANALTLQFLDWVASGRRTHADVMDAWRSSCPRLSIWEDALLDGLVRYDGDRRIVELTEQGLAALGRETRHAAE
ncbi:MAG: hypothetical protein FJX60_10350 [Alphaproteobacteria bacterium]|nr:hypothetical protein [Alphaproteobacteria bacterium]